MQFEFQGRGGNVAFLPEAFSCRLNQRREGRIVDPTFEGTGGRRRGAGRAGPKYGDFGEGCRAEAIGTEDPAHGLARRKQTIDTKRPVPRALALNRGAVRVGPQAAHMIVRARSHFPRLVTFRDRLAEGLYRIAVCARQAGLQVAHEIGSGAGQNFVAGHIEIGAAVRAATAAGDGAHDGSGAFGACALIDAVENDLTVLVAEHAKETRRGRLANEKSFEGRGRGEAERQKLDLLHIHQLRAGAGRDRVAVAGVATHCIRLRKEQSRKPACRDDDGRCSDGNQLTA